MEDTWVKYAEEFTSSESDVLQSLARECYANYSNHSMLSGFFQGRVLSMLSKMIQPRAVLEIGTYLGYSALCFAEGLAEGGKVITLDVDEATNRVAKSFVAKSPYAKSIEFHLGPATEIIPKLPETFDLVFIDADKPNYSNYYQLVFDKVRSGGFIIADNVLWSGKVLLKDQDQDETTKALHSFNGMVKADSRVSDVLLPIRDGLMIVRGHRFDLVRPIARRPILGKRRKCPACRATAAERTFDHAPPAADAKLKFDRKYPYVSRQYRSLKGVNHHDRYGNPVIESAQHEREVAALNDMRRT